MTRASVLAVLAVAACGGGPKKPTKSKPKPPTPSAPASSSTVGPDSSKPVGTTAAGTGDVVGTAHPLVVEAAARDGGWIVICQARIDDDRNGTFEVSVGMHGDTWGDELRPYLVRGAGEGEPIDSLVGFTRDGRWLVALRTGKLELFDAHRGGWSELVGADVRDDRVPLGPHRAASLARAGDRMTYFRDDETIVVRELSTGSERTVKVPGVRLWRVEVEPLGHWALLYAIRTDSDKDGKLTWPSLHTSLSHRDCRGPIASYSTHGWSGDTPDELWLEMATGKIHTARAAGLPAEPDTAEESLGFVDGRAVLAVDAAGRRLLGPDESHRDIPNGPLRWVAPPE